MKKVILTTIILVFAFCVANAQIITTIAGNGTESFGGDNGAATDAELDGPYSVAVDNSGNVYIADGYNNRIRKINNLGIITTIAGNDTAGYNGDNIPATSAQLQRPIGVTCDHAGNIFIGDAFNNRVRKIDTSGIITTVAGNGSSVYNGDNILATAAAVNNPHCVAIDDSGNLYITELDGHRVRKVSASGIITTIAGTGMAGNTGNNGPATAAEIDTPYGIAVDSAGNIYFADSYSLVVRKIDATGIITTFAGGGGSLSDNVPADSVRLDAPAGVAVDRDNVYISDALHHRVRKVNTTSNIITAVAGNGIHGFSGDNGLAVEAELNEPDGIAIDTAGNVYFADFGNNRIRYIKNITAVNQLSKKSYNVLLYPNPTIGTFTFSIISGNKEKFLIAISNSAGEQVKEFKANSNSSVTVNLNQPAGIYYLTAISGNNRLTAIINLIK